MKKIVKRSKRLGRGYGSGRGGHTVGRGARGQKARNNMGILFEGFKVKKSLLRRLPLQRGKTKLKPGKKAVIVNLEVLNLLKDGSKVTIETLASEGIVKLADAKVFGVKILGGGSINKKLDVMLPTSSAAASKIQKAGGKVIQK